MSYFDDQMDAWFDGNCQGNIDDIDPHGDDYLNEEIDECNGCSQKAMKPLCNWECERLGS